MPWADKSGLAKATAVLATIFLVSLGLCGVNFVMLSGNVMSGADGFLFVTAYLELFGMAVGGGGLLVLALMAIIRAAVDSLSSRSSDSVSIIEKDEEK